MIQEAPPKFIRESNWATTYWRTDRIGISWYKAQNIKWGNQARLRAWRNSQSLGPFVEAPIFWVRSEGAVRVTWFRYTITCSLSLKGMCCCRCMLMYCWGPAARYWQWFWVEVGSIYCRLSLSSSWVEGGFSGGEILVRPPRGLSSCAEKRG